LRRVICWTSCTRPTLERIFIEERIYKRIEQKKSADEVNKAVISGFKPFTERLLRPVDLDDVERLLKIPNQAHQSVLTLRKTERHRSDQCKPRRDRTQACRLGRLRPHLYCRAEDDARHQGTSAQDTIKTFELVDVKEEAERNLAVKYDLPTATSAYAVKQGNTLLEVSTFDRVLIIRKDGTYQVIDAPEKEFVGKGLLILRVRGQERACKPCVLGHLPGEDVQYLFLKRCQIIIYQMKKVYPLLPEGNFKLVKLSTYANAELTLSYKPKPGLRILEEKFYSPIIW
jgi:topoisomerase-4 subunit A